MWESLKFFWRQFVSHRMQNGIGEGKGILPRQEQIACPVNQSATAVVNIHIVCISIHFFVNDLFGCYAGNVLCLWCMLAHRSGVYGR